MLSPPLLALPISPQSCLGALALAPLHPLRCPRPFSSSSVTFYPRPLVAPSPSIPALLRARRSVPVPPDAPSSLSSLQSARFLPPPFPPSLSSHFHSVPAGHPISTPSSFPGSGCGPPSSGPKLSPCLACSDLHPFSFSSRGGGAAPQKRHGLGPRGLGRSMRTRFAALAGLSLQWPLVPLRGRPGGQELGAHSCALREQQVGVAPRGSHGGAVEAGPGVGAGRAAALESMWESVLEGFL